MTGLTRKYSLAASQDRPALRAIVRPESAQDLKSSSLVRVSATTSLASLKAVTNSLGND